MGSSQRPIVVHLTTHSGACSSYVHWNCSRWRLARVASGGELHCSLSRHCLLAARERGARGAPSAPMARSLPTKRGTRPTNLELSGSAKKRAAPKALSAKVDGKLATSASAAGRESFSLESFERWLDSQGVRLNRECVRLVSHTSTCGGLGLAVFAEKDIVPSEVLCRIPKAACLSIRTASCAKLIRKKRLGGGLGLVLAVMMERALGNESKWSGYFASLPDREYLPIFWDDDLKGLLIGTEIEASVAEDEALMAADYAQNIVPLLDRLGALSSRCQLDDFCKAASLVASRAFGIDDYHGDAMVPVADIFNHKASVVELAPEYEVVGASSSDDEVEEGGEGVLPPNEEEDEDASSDEEDGSGSSGESSGDEQSSKAGDSGTDESDHESLTEHESLTSHPASGPERRMVTDPAAPLPSVLGRSEVNGLHLRLEIGIVDGEANEEEVDIIAASKVAQGREVHNTYGELGNAELVAKYGFALVENPFTTVKLCKSFLLQCSKLPSQLRSQRCTFLKEHTDLLDQEEEPICVLPRGHVNAGLWAVLLTLSAPQAEFQSWKGIEDALRAGGGDSAPKNQPTICHEECTAEHSHVHAAPDVVVDEFGSIVLRDVLSVLEASWQQSLAAILREAVQHRAGKYGAMLEEDRAALSACEEAFARRDGAAPLSEREAAMLAARRLRVDEQLILHECLEALGS